MDSDDETIVSDDANKWVRRDESQSAEDRKKLRDRYQELIDAAQREKENESFNDDNLLNTMSEADKLFQQVSRPREAMYDAALLNIHGEIARKKAHQIQSGTPFSCQTFIKRVIESLTGKPMKTDVVNLDRDAWLKLGNQAFPMFNRTPKLSFMNGVFSEPVQRARAPRQAANSEEPSTTTVAKILESSAHKEHTDKTYGEVERVKRILHKMYKQKGGPVGYFEFVIDPDSFSRTVENMFHVSFLVKDREVCLSSDSNGLPVIEPILSQGDAAGRTVSQSVMTMNVEKWKKLIERLNIKEAAIPPPPGPSRHGSKK